VWQEVLSGQPPGLYISGLSYSPNPIPSGTSYLTTFTAYVIYNLNTNQIPKVYLNLSSVKGSNVTMNYVSPLTFQIVTHVGPVNSGVYNIKIYAKTNTGSASRVFQLNFQLTSGSYGLTITSVSLDNLEPLHLSNDQIFVSIYNPSPKAESFQLIYTDTYKGTSSKINTSTGNPSPTLTIQPFTSITLTTTWFNVGGSGPASGTHVLYVNFTNVTPFAPAKGGNISLTVLPKILLVDDEGISPNNPQSVLNFYTNMFTYTSYSADLQIISPGQLASISGYDLLIWITGYKGTVTSNQGFQISNFINNGGSVLLISNNTYSYSSYLSSSFGITPGGLSLPNPYKIQYSNFTNPNLVVNITCNVNYPTGTINAVSFTGGISLAKFETITLPSVIYGSSKGKYVFIGYEFSSMYIYQQDYVMNKIIMWLSNINIRYGNDLALSDLKITPVNPYFMQNVTLSFVIINYSPKPLTDVSLEVLVDNMPIKGQPIYTINYINGNGTYLIYNITWQATTPGPHTIYGYVNPFHTIPEVNYNNNALNSMVNTTILVRYSILVIWVHGDTDKNNNITTLANTLNNLGIKYKFLDYNEGNSQSYHPNLNDSSSIYYFLKYNLLIVDFNQTGDLSSSPWGNELANAIYNYLNNKNATKYPYSLLITGENAGIAINSNSTIQNILKITYINTLQIKQPNNRGYLYGLVYNGANTNTGPLGQNLSRGYGLYYQYNNYLTIIKLNPNVYGTAIFDVYNYTPSSKPNYTGNAVIENISNVIVTIFPYSIENIIGFIQNHTISYSPRSTSSNPLFMTLPNSAQYARNFLMMNFLVASRYMFNNALPEITSPDIYINSPIVSLNNYYLITVTIRNLGAVSTYVTLQAFEETSMFYSSEPIYLVGSTMNSITTVTATLIWKPSYVSSPNPEWLRFVLIPASGQIPSSPMQEALISQPVYYFYDNGSTLSGWTHYNVIAYITGENLFGLSNPYTSIYSNWSNGQGQQGGDKISITYGLTNKQYFSYPFSYWIQDVIDYGNKPGNFAYVYYSLPSVKVPQNGFVTLSWYWKYSIALAQNGLFLMVEVSTGQQKGWYQVYLPYNNNPDLGNIVSVTDPNQPSLSAKIYQAFNGVSGGGTFSWEYYSINTNSLYVMDPSTGLPLSTPLNVSGKFITFYFYYISPDIYASSYSGSNVPGIGTYIDNVLLSVTNGGNDGWRVIVPNQNSNYYGISTDGISYLGFNGSPTTYLIADYNNNQGYPSFNDSLWDHLITPPIDLVNSLTASLNFTFKANIAQGLYGDGWPPDEFILSISNNNGASWTQLYSPPTYPTNPILPSSTNKYGQSGGGTVYYTGSGCLPANNANSTYWLTVSIPLNFFVGQSILLDFQIITNNGWTISNIFKPWHAVGYTDPKVNPFLGFYMTNILIQGNSYFTPIYVQTMWV
jgi:hypothetical protein